MRRADREITDLFEIESIITESTICRIGFAGRVILMLSRSVLATGTKQSALIQARPKKNLDTGEKNPWCGFEIDLYDNIISTGRPCDWDMRCWCVIGFEKA